MTGKEEGEKKGGGVYVTHQTKKSAVLELSKQGATMDKGTLKPNVQPKISSREILKPKGRRV